MVTRCGCNLTIMPFVYLGHNMHTAVTNLHCVYVENSMWSSLSLLFSLENVYWWIEEKFLQYPALFFGFYCWFLVYLKSTLNLLFCRAFSYSYFAVLNMSSLEFFNSLSGMEFGICFMTFGEWFDKPWM